MTKSQGIRIRRGTRIKWAGENQGQHKCECGCGKAVIVRPEHYPRVPRFVHGHNPVVTHAKPKPKAKPCECGCDELAAPGMRFRYGHQRRGHKVSDETRAKLRAQKRGSKNPQFGRVRDEHPTYKGGRVKRGQDGYILILAPDHPFAIPRYVMEHRLILEEHLRRTDPTSPFLVDVNGAPYLSPKVEVHHINGIRDDNRIENLQPMSKAEHAEFHGGRFRGRWAIKHDHCIECGTTERYHMAKGRCYLCYNKGLPRET